MSLRLSDVSALAVSIDQLARWLRRQAPQTMSLSALSVLARLDADGPLRVSDLTEREALTQPGMTVLVNRLSDAGYAERVPDPTDRRAALVRLTDGGRAVLTERRDARARILRDRLAQLSEHDRDLLMAALPAIERLVNTPTTTGKKSIS